MPTCAPHTSYTSAWCGQRPSLRTTLAMAYGALGIVYGDIGTSPLYAFPAIFTTIPNPK